MRSSPRAGYISIIEAADSLSFATSELWGLQLACISILRVGAAPIRHLLLRRARVDVLTLPGEPAAAIYAWTLCLPAVTIGAIGNVMHWLHRPLYRQADIFARPRTIGRMHFMRDTGFVASAFCIPNLWMYQRHPRSNFESFN
jgi:hypothetical protein